MNELSVAIFIGLFGFVTILGFVAARWRKADLKHIHEWGLGGRRFGTLVTWFLLGGDLYPAYPFIAVPALIFGGGAAGFFAVPYGIWVYPLMFLVLPRLWRVTRDNGYVTAADLVRGSFGNQWLALAVAFTGVVATMPYIALQLVGLEVVLAAMGLQATGMWSHLPLIVAFAILGAFTYSSGLRAPALIAVVKDLLIYVTVIAAIIVIPSRLGGYDAIFASVETAKLTLPTPPENSLGGFSAYVTLALGSAMALMLYPHAMTGVLSASGEKVVRRNAAILPAYSLALGLIALLGYMAIAAGVQAMPEFAHGFEQYGANYAVPALFLHTFPSWFAGVAFAAIAIGALVPAAVMSIACGNLFTRNVYKEFLKPKCSVAEECQVAELVSLVVKIGALFFIIFLPQQYAIQLQLLGGIWIIQTLPSVILVLYTRWLNSKALLIGWAAGIASGTYMSATLNFAGTVFPLEIFGFAVPGYAALYSLGVNLVVSIALSSVFNAWAPDRAVHAGVKR
ncbi:MAG: monocarboxylate uptake permease MctP [Alphaproteobacteria bacterium]